MLFLISIHAPREGSDPFSYCVHVQLFKFLSTLPVRGATPARRVYSMPWKFLSTLPVRGATMRPGSSFWTRTISIHAPREGSDSWQGLSEGQLYNFYPRSP